MVAGHPCARLRLRPEDHAQGGREKCPHRIRWVLCQCRVPCQSAHRQSLDCGSRRYAPSAAGGLQFRLIAPRDSRGYILDAILVADDPLSSNGIESKNKTRKLPLVTGMVGIDSVGCVPAAGSDLFLG